MTNQIYRDLPRMRRLFSEVPLAWVEKRFHNQAGQNFLVIGDRRGGWRYQIMTRSELDAQIERWQQRQSSIDGVYPEERYAAKGLNSFWWFPTSLLADRAIPMPVRTRTQSGKTLGKYKWTPTVPLEAQEA